MHVLTALRPRKRQPNFLLDHKSIQNMCGRTRFTALSNERLGQLQQHGSVARRRSTGRQQQARSSSSMRSRPVESPSGNDDEHVEHTEDVEHDEEDCTKEVETFPSVENVSPGYDLPVLYFNHSEAQVTIEKMTWGLIPQYISRNEKPNHYALFNKRMESIESGNYFFNLVSAKRCVLVVDGFYEWRTIAGKKQPYYVYFTGDVMQMAAIYEDSQFLDVHTNEVVMRRTFAILTGEPCVQFKEVHTRQPAFLSSSQIETWLHPSTSANILLQILDQNAKDSKFELNTSIKFHPVHKNMTDAKYQQADCSQPIKLGANISSFFGNSMKASSPKLVNHDDKKPSIEKGEEDSTSAVTGIAAKRSSAPPLSTVSIGTSESHPEFHSPQKKAKVEYSIISPTTNKTTEVIDLSLDDSDHEGQGTTAAAVQQGAKPPHSPHKINSYFNKTSSPNRASWTSPTKSGTSSKSKTPPAKVQGIAKFFTKV